MMTTAAPATISSPSRIAWVDTAKGICIIMVVMMHSTLGVEADAGRTGWMGEVVTFARPFRMPDFFLISGLFLGLVIDRPWMRYLDRKVVHFAYFYVLWLTIQFAFKAPAMAAEDGAAAALGQYLLAFVQPFGTLWFIYILPVFFLFTRMVRRLPVWFVLAWAAVLEMLPVHTGWVVFDEFASRYVWFFIGYAFAVRIFDIADWARRNTVLALVLLAVWAPLNAWLAFSPPTDALAVLLQPELQHAGARGSWAELSGVSFLLSFAGIFAVIFTAVLLDGRRGMQWLTWLGSHSIVVYLAFFLPMVVTRIVLLRTGIVTDIGTISFLTMVAAVAGPVVLYGLVQWTGWGRFLFERPRWAYVDRAPASRKDRLVAAE